MNGSITEYLDEAVELGVLSAAARAAAEGLLARSCQTHGPITSPVEVARRVVAGKILKPPQARAVLDSLSSQTEGTIVEGGAARSETAGTIVEGGAAASETAGTRRSPSASRGRWWG